MKSVRDSTLVLNKNAEGAVWMSPSLRHFGVLRAIVYLPPNCLLTELSISSELSTIILIAAKLVATLAQIKGSIEAQVN